MVKQEQYCTEKSFRRERNTLKKKKSAGLVLIDLFECLWKKCAFRIDRSEVSAWNCCI